MTAVPTRPAGRYGDPTRRRWSSRVLLGLVCVAGVAWSLWYAHSRYQAVSFTTQAYQVVDAGTVRVTFSVTKPAGTSASCRVQALSSGSAQVGLVVVAIGPQRASENRTVTVRTQQLAVTGEVLDCRRA